MRVEAKGYNGQIVIDGEWLEINRKGGLALLSQGLKGSKRIPLANITSVQLKGASALTNGYIQFSLLGSAETKGGLFDATSDENSVVFRKPHQEQFEAVRTSVESYIENRIKGQNQAYQSTAPDIAEQLTKLAVLRDQGILTSDEFDDQKAKLLRG